jgi:hypothetical protein
MLDREEGWRPDILVTDYNLGPGPNGVDVAAAAARRLPGLPTIYATGNPECLPVLGSRERIVAKPFVALNLIKAVSELAALAGICLPNLVLPGSSTSAIEPFALAA